MRPVHHHHERHNSHRVGWLRAAVLGANDGTISVASLVVGIAASGAGRPTLLLSGLAATVAGALSMAAGEYVSVQSQADTEAADLAREKQELADDPSGVLAELAQIYVERGLSRDLARQVAEQLTLQDALGAHRRDELGQSDAWQARPIQAALASAASFLVGALLPILTLLVSPPSRIRDVTTLVALLALMLLGALAMGLTALVGRLFGATI